MSRGRPPTLDELLGALGNASIGDPGHVPTEGAPEDDPMTMLGHAANILLADLAHERAARDRALADVKALATRLEAERAQLAAVLRQLPAGVVVADAAEGRILLQNEDVARLLPGGAPAEGLADLGPAAPPLRRALAGELVEAEEVAVRRDGGEAVLRLHAGPVRDREGRVFAAVLVLDDVTEERRAEAELRAANVRLQGLDALKTEFVNTAAHELKTPLTPVRLQLDLLRSRALAPETRRALDVMERNVDRLARLADDLIDAARLQAGRLVVEERPLDLAEAVRDGIDAFGELARRKGVALEPEVAGPLEVVGDPARLAEVVYNLLSNAIRVTPPGGRIAVVARRENGEAVVRVRDTGVGLRLEELAQLFQPFSHVGEESTPGRAQTGLGLYISRGIVERHGGRIWAASEGRGRGATFGFAVPLRAAPEAATGTEGPDARVERPRPP